jgi:threonine dehydrogenase-like Zn-dependent dehydrogenase
VVFRGVGDIRLEDVLEPKIQAPTDAVVRLTASAICGTDLHMVRGTMAMMKPGTILGHEGVGIVEELGPDVRNFSIGDRVVIASTIACGYCSYCRSGYFAQCDNANPNGPHSGSAFFGGPEMTGPFNGLQAERARILAIDSIPSRLEMARAQGAEVLDFNAEHPVEVVRQLTGGIGVDRAIDAVGVDAERPRSGPAAKEARQQAEQFDKEVEEIAPEASPEAEHRRPGDAPSQALIWAVDALAKAGTLSIIGVYPQTVRSFLIGVAMNKNLTINMGNCNHRKYIPMLVDMVRSGEVDPVGILTQHEPLGSALDAYTAFDERQEGWIKVKLEPVG